ncbi:MAG TPA: hypothetical protein VFP65_18375 [Anaeromyxobacteraceae bacterium]|nr:hypothetical protein [Anaeromyxobacteraceae bacterium]
MDRYGTPVHYPTACRPQAWASASVVLLARSLLGLDVDALERRVVVAPTLVPGLTRLDLVDLPIAAGRVDVSMSVDGGVATAEVRGLPDGWERTDPTVPD